MMAYYKAGLAPLRWSVPLLPCKKTRFLYNKATIMTAADDEFCDIFFNFRKK